ncbi:18015_t:CDS:2, partial [Racocetra fulgida]
KPKEKQPRLGGILDDNVDYSSLDNVEEGRPLLPKRFPRTWILSAFYEDRLKTSLDEIGGVIRFLPISQSQPSNEIDLIIIHMPLFHRSIEKHYFVVEKVEFLELYSLKTGELHKLFHVRKELSQLITGGNSLVEISKNDVLMAYCSGTNSISLYLMENSLEIATQMFPNLYRINSLDFIHDDEKLLIIGEEESIENDELITVFVIWDLFSASEKSIITIKDTEKLIPTKFQDYYYRFSSASGNIVCIDEENGNVFSILDHPSLQDSLNPPPNSLSGLIQLNFQDARKQMDQVNHIIFTQDGKFFDARQEPRDVIIVYSTEPWVRFGQYPRISAYLNDDKTYQVIIGQTTIQVWSRTDDLIKRRLEYIWTSVDKTEFDIQSISIGNGEFFIDISFPDKGNVQIHWPYNRHTLKDACTALEYFYSRRTEPTSMRKKHMFNILVRQTTDMLMRIMTTNPDLWRMTDARYEIMQSLIRGRCVSLIKKILSEGYHGTNLAMGKNLHFPRQYEWPLEPKISDLELAIKCAGANRNDTVIVGYLLNYYSDNAMNNAGWMTTVSSALPELYDHNMEINVDVSFINPEDLHEAHYKTIHALDLKPALLRKSVISPEQLKKKLSLIKAISSLKGMFSFEQLAREAEETYKNFTVYPQGVVKDHTKIPLLLRILRALIWPRAYDITEDSQCSPFLRTICRDKSDVVFSNPAIAAIIDYKWSTARAFEDAQSSGEDAVLKYRADLIFEYETLVKLFGKTREDSRYIYYVGKSDDLDQWLSKVEEYQLTHRSLLDEEVDLSSDWSTTQLLKVSSESQSGISDRKPPRELDVKSQPGIDDLRDKIKSMEYKIEKILELLIKD